MSIEPKILELADKLGQAMAEAKRTRKYKEMEDAVRNDPDALSILRQHQELTIKLAEKEQNNQPIEVEEKHALSDVQEKLYGNDKLKDLMQAQVDYLEMIQTVNDRMSQHMLSPEELEAMGEED